MTKTVLSTTLLAALSGSMLLAQQQPSNNQETGLTTQISAQGGLGAAAPWEGQIQLEYRNNRIELKPFAGITGVTRNSSEEEELSYHYTRTGNTYSSSRNLEKEGYRLNYGSTIGFSLHPKVRINAQIKVMQDDLKAYGQGHEVLSYADPIEALSPNDVTSRYYSPKQDHTNMVASAEMNFLPNADNRDNQLNVKYEFTSDRTENEQQLEFNPNAGTRLLLYENILTQSEAKVQSHFITSVWRHIFRQSMGSTLSSGISYRDRNIESHDHQRWNGNDNPTQDFDHRMQNLSLFAEIQYPVIPLGELVLSANARIAYEYTRMQKKNLNDFIPQATLILPMANDQVITAAYVRRIIRPDLDRLNPMQFFGYHTLDFGNPNLEGIHLNNASLSYRKRFNREGDCTHELSATVAHIFVKDGFNAIWMEKENRRVSTWGNAGERKAWSLTPALKLQPRKEWLLQAKATLLWDKRIAEAISMAKEHWGITAECSAKYTQKRYSMEVHGLYAEGNTVDLYSHAGRSLKAGASSQIRINRAILLQLSYDCCDYARTHLTQGAYTGTLFRHPSPQYEALAKAVVTLK